MHIDFLQWLKDNKFEQELLEIFELYHHHLHGSEAQQEGAGKEACGAQTVSRTFLELRGEVCGAQTVSHTFLEQKRAACGAKTVEPHLPEKQQVTAQVNKMTGDQLAVVPTWDGDPIRFEEYREAVLLYWSGTKPQARPQVAARLV